MAAARRTRLRRTPRRRFHALHADIALVLALAAGLAASFPPMKAAPPSRPVPGGFSAAVAATPGEAPGEPVASPLLFAFGSTPDPARAPLPDVPEPPRSALVLRPAWEPPAAAGFPAGPAPLVRLALPIASMLAGLSPAVPLFSEPRPAPPAPPPAPPAEPVSVVRFRSAPDAPPVVLLDAPGASPARLRELEAAAYAEGR